MSDLEVGRGRIPLALTFHGKVTSYILGDKYKLYHQSGPSSSLWEGMGRGHMLMIRSPGMGVGGRGPGRGGQRFLGCSKWKALVGLVSRGDGR